MTVYQYRASTAEGGKRRATITSTSIRAARTSLSAQGLDVRSLRERRGLAQMELLPQRVKHAELMHLSRQLAAFLRAGIAILDALDSLIDGATNRSLARTLREMRDGLAEGDTFAEVVAEHPKVFPATYHGMVASAELTGNLDDVLDQLAVYLERDEDTRREIRAAMIYPGIITAMALLTVITLSVFVMPRFESFFESMGATLPLPTRALLATTGFIGNWWWALLLGGVAAGFAFVAIRRTPRGRLVVDRFILRLPLVGETVRYAIVERLCRTLGTMVSTGVPLPSAMVVAAQGTNNTVYSRGIDAVREGMIRGEGLAQPVVDTALFPSAMTQMVRAGEATGTLDDQLGTAATYFGHELKYKLKKLTSFFEPLVILGVGGMVGFVAVALVSAMYGIFRQVGVG